MPCPICSDLEGPPKSDLNPAPLNTIEAMRRSASSCASCALVLCGFEKCLPDLRYRDNLSVYVTQPSSVRPLSLLSGNFLEPDGSQVGTIEYFITQGDPPTPWGGMNRTAGYKTCGQTGSTAAFEQIKSWLSLCLSDQHPHCTGFHPCPLPKRVLDVSGTSIKLYETQGENALYACLSHCWGKRPIITTTTENKDRHITRIPWHSLSKTFQDAITCVRFLNIKYIWIDSLCILQDSRADWTQEAPKMADIYSGARLTIAGTKSTSSESGLFCETGEYKFIGLGPRGENFRWYARKEIEHLCDSTSSPEAFPLLTRGWVYQERLLSQRVIHFGSQELSWECGSASLCECGYPGTVSNRINSKRDLRSILMPSEAEKKSLTQKSNDADIQSLWRSMASEYSSLKLTKHSDRLPALTGLAARVNERRRENSRITENYAAGIWRDSIVKDLLWFTPQPGRPSKLEAPSWSWACVLNSVNFFISAGFDEELEAVYVKFHFLDSLVSCGLSTFTFDGPSGLLVVEGSLAQLNIRDGSQGEVKVNFEGLSVERNGLTATNVFFDAFFRLSGASYTLFPGSKIWGLKMVDTQSYELSLALRALDEQTNTYQRIGLIMVSIEGGDDGSLNRLRANSWYDGVDSQVVKIR